MSIAKRKSSVPPVQRPRGTSQPKPWMPHEQQARQQPQPCRAREPQSSRSSHPSYEAYLRLRSLLTQASGTIADVANQLESHAVDIGDGGRAQLDDDLLVLDEELTIVKALLAGALDWDAGLQRLLDGEIPPIENDSSSEGDE